MKILLLENSATVKLVRILREHFIQEESLFFINKLSRITKVSLQADINFQALLQFQICKIILHQLYAYIEEGRISDYIRHMTYDHFPVALYIRPFYVTDVLGDYYRSTIPEIDHCETENDLITCFHGYITSIYNADKERFKQVFTEIMQMYVQYMPSNVRVLRFDLSPTLSPVVCYTEQSLLHSLCV